MLNSLQSQYSGTTFEGYGLNTRQIGRGRITWRVVKGRRSYLKGGFYD